MSLEMPSVKQETEHLIRFFFVSYTGYAGVWGIALWSDDAAPCAFPRDHIILNLRNVDNVLSAVSFVCNSDI